FGIVGLVSGLIGCFGVGRILAVLAGFLGRFLVDVLARFLGDVALADALAIGNAKHHDHVVGLVLGQQLARDVPPVEVALGLIADEAGVEFVQAHHGDLGRVSEGILQPVGQPVGHAVAHDDNAGGGRDRAVGLARRRGARRIGVLARRRQALLAFIGALVGTLIKAFARRTEEVLEEAVRAVAALTLVGTVAPELRLRRRTNSDFDGNQAGAFDGGQEAYAKQPLPGPKLAKHAIAQGLSRGRRKTSHRLWANSRVKMSTRRSPLSYRARNWSSRLAEANPSGTRPIRT